MAEQAAIGLSTIDGNGVLHVRSWPVPAYLTGEFTEEMTARFGEPDEMVGDADTIQEAGERTAAESGTVYMLAGED